MAHVQHVIPPILGVVHHSPHQIDTLENVLFHGLCENLLRSDLLTFTQGFLEAPDLVLVRKWIGKLHKGNDCLASATSTATLLHGQLLHLRLLHFHHRLWLQHPRSVVLQGQATILVVTPSVDHTPTSERIAHAIQSQDLNDRVRAQLLDKDRLVTSLCVAETELPIRIVAPGVDFAKTCQGKNMMFPILDVYNLACKVWWKRDFPWLRAGREVGPKT
mmetsp:Transcript_52356/g.84806  ORF Transcript_52356/g.84806 Transcript_52356/m.84806 type:complete len:218 (+) Transcript_52356:707-1360(+)